MIGSFIPSINPSFLHPLPPIPPFPLPNSRVSAYSLSLSLATWSDKPNRLSPFSFLHFSLYSLSFNPITPSIPVLILLFLSFPSYLPSLYSSTDSFTPSVVFASASRHSAILAIIPLFLIILYLILLNFILPFWNVGAKEWKKLRGLGTRAKGSRRKNRHTH